jgi:hypothetical protein
MRKDFNRREETVTCGARESIQPFSLQAHADADDAALHCLIASPTPASAPWPRRGFSSMAKARLQLPVPSHRMALEERGTSRACVLGYIA